MAAPRGLARLAHRTLLEDVRSELTALGWFAAGGAKSVPVTLIDEDQPSGAQVAPNTVCVTIGGDVGTDVAQLGDGLRAVEWACFVDIWGENESISLAIAEDLREHLAERTFELLDVDGTGTGIYLEVTQVFRQKPDPTVRREYRKFWQIVKLGLRCEYPT